MVGDSTVPGDSERLDKHALDCLISLEYLQCYFMPEILIGFRPSDCAGKVRVLMLFWHLVGDQLTTPLDLVTGLKHHIG